MKILVTGATGYLGSHIAKKLNLITDNKVYALVRDSSKAVATLPSEIVIKVYDGTYDSLVQIFSESRFDLVIHIAALATYETNAKNIKDLVASNLELSTYLLQAMATSGCSRLINTGTFWQHYSGESYNPVCLYAAMKQAVEEIIEYYVQAYSFQVITLKVTDVYGPNDPRRKVFSLLRDIKKNNATVSLSKGEQQINLLYIDDAVNAYLRAVDLLKEKDDKSFHQRYFVANGNSISLRNLVDKYQQISGEKLEISYTNPYRQREIMQPYIGTLLTDWHSDTPIDTGIKNVIAAE